MRKHNGMRPHDIVILLKIASKQEMNWYMKDLSYELGISGSEVSESINRSIISGLMFPDKKRLMKTAILDFLQYGLPYVYPQQPGALVRGIATAHSAPPLNEVIESQEAYVWPYGKGNLRGQSIEPLHPNVPEACIMDEKFYELMSLCDVLRIGRVREKKWAIEELKNRLC